MGAALAVLLLGGGLATGPLAAPAGAQAAPDQETPNRECTTEDYPGSKVVTTEPSRQSFVPTRGGVATVELCLSNFVPVPGTDFFVTIYPGDNPTTPPTDPLAPPFPVDVDLPFLSATWFPVTFPAELPTVPGVSYILEVDPVGELLSSVSFQWLATCSDSLLRSCAGVEDSYPRGRTNDLPGNADYGFRTIPLHDADLVGQVSVDGLVCPGLDLTGRATGTVLNDSRTSVGAFRTQWLWSSDPTADDQDRRLGDPYAIDGMAADEQVSVPAPTLHADAPMGDGYLLLQLDIDEAILESDDRNNVAGDAATVIECGQPEVANLALTVDEAEVPTGFHQLQFDNLDRRALATLPQSRAEVVAGPAFSANGFSANGFSANGFSANGFSANGFSANGFSANGFSANGFSANGFSANGFSPAGDLSLAALLAELPDGYADGILVVDVPIAGRGWAERLEPLTRQPIQEITLAEAVSLLGDEVTVGEVDLSRVLNLSWLALATAGGEAEDFPLREGTWCGLVTDSGFICGAGGLDPATMSLAQLEARGFPSFRAPIADLRLDEVTLDDELLVLGLPLSGEPRFNLEFTRLGALAAEDALGDEASVVDCGVIGCSQPLASQAAEGAFRAGTTVRDLIANLTDDGRRAALLGDLAMGTASLNTLRLSSANWNTANAFQMDPACPAMTYRLAGDNVGDGNAVDPTAAVTLAPGFVYVPGSVALVADGAPAATQPEPTETIADDGTRSYSFELDASIGDSFALTFSACASVYLGHFDVGSATVSGIGIDHPYEASTSGEPDVVRVVERTPGVTTQALAHEDNIVVADHVSSANGHDLWTFPVKPEPGTMYIVKLFNPLGVDLDLIGYGPAVSANGFSANGFSANGFSANGFSANGFSANGFSANGFSANGFSANGFSANGFSHTAESEVQSDIPIEELAPPNSRGHLVSSHRGDDTETLYAFSTFGDEGRLTFAVADYSGGRTDAPYFMTVQTVRPTRNPALDECAAAPWDLAQAHGSAPPAWSGAEPPRTLFVTNRQVAASVHGADKARDGIAALRELAARPEVRGIVVEADHHPDVRAAYANWRANWCNPTAANIAASHVRSLVLDLRRTHPTIDTIVIAGGDEVVPDFRLNDGSILANEEQYTEALLKATGGKNNALVAAYANRLLPSPDPYGNEAPLPFGNSLAFPPSAGVSRLVETPDDWVAQKDQYVLANGRLDPADGLVTGYDGMVDGAEAAADVLRGAGVPTSTLTDTSSSWTANDFRARAFGANAPGIQGWNAHANHFAILSDRGSEQNDETELVRSTELRDFPLGRFVFSNGCHFGTSVPDALNRTPTEAEADRLLDWNQAIAQRRGIAVTNTGFGIFDTEVVGQGERLHELFLERLTTARTAALALAQAKNEFLATVGVHDAYSFKTAQQLGMYGLGILTMSDGTTPPPTPAPEGSIDVTAGPYGVASVPSGCTTCYLTRPTELGTAVDLRDPSASTGHTSSNGYWSAPLSTRKVPLPPGMLSAGLWINGLQSTTLEDVDQVTTRLAVSDPRHAPETQAAGPFPTSMGTVYDVAGEAVITLLHGISTPVRKQGGKVTSDLELYTTIDADVFLRPAGTIGVTPVIDEVTFVRPTEDSNLVVVDVLAPGSNVRAAVLARDDLGTWTYRELGPSGEGHWSGAIALSSGATELRDAYVQVFNGLDVGTWRFKGDKPPVRTGVVDGVDLALAGDRHPSGVFESPVTATILGRPGVIYTVYVNDHFHDRYTNGQSFELTADGSHDIVVEGSDGSTYVGSVAIDRAGPTIEWESPAAGATFMVGDDVPLEVRCVDAGTGASCSATVNGADRRIGGPLPTATAGTYTVVVSAEDGVGNTATSTRTYTVQARYVFSPFHSPIAAKPTLNSATAGSNITLKFDVTNAQGVEYTDPSIISGRFWQKIHCTTKAPLGALFGAGGTNPAYSGFFHFNVPAPKDVACYELFVVLNDGTTQSAYFTVKKK